MAVLSNNDGCVVARRREAKACGIKMGESWFKIARDAERQGVVAFSSNYAYYADMPHRVMAILSQLTPRLEIYSIYEAFCCLAGIPATQLESLGRRLATMGFTTALQLSDMPAAVAHRQFWVLEHTVRELNGISCLGLEEFAAPKVQIVGSRSFCDKPTELDCVSQAICAHAERTAQKLRGERQFCRHISVFVATSPFAAGETYYGNQATARPATPPRTAVTSFRAHAWRRYGLPGRVADDGKMKRQRLSLAWSTRLHDDPVVRLK